jgi:hypothetical protein
MGDGLLFSVEPDPLDKQPFGIKDMLSSAILGSFSVYLAPYGVGCVNQPHSQLKIMRGENAEILGTPQPLWWFREPLKPVDLRRWHL